MRTWRSDRGSGNSDGLTKYKIVATASHDYRGLRMTELTKTQQRPAHLWRPGQSGNPGGRPKGSRNRLSEDFIAALQEDFQDHGSAAIAACRAEKPDVYLRIIAGILPKDVHLKVQPLDDLTDDQLMRKLAALTEMAKPLLARITDRTDARAEHAADV
jgi:hypothetical protein